MAKSHQRLVKYPLLLQRILDATSANHKDNLILEQSVQLSKDILNHVNDEIEEAENELRLEELQKKVEDKRTLDGTDHEEIGVRMLSVLTLGEILRNCEAKIKQRKNRKQLLLDKVNKNKNSIIYTKTRSSLL